MLLVLSLLQLMMGAMGEKRLVHLPLSLTWSKAQAHCRSLHMDLVTIRTDKDNKKIVVDSWLGLHRDNSSSDWKWSRDDEPLNFRADWAGNDPTNGEDCVFKHASNGKWSTRGCSQEQQFYCDGESMYLVKEKKTWEEALAHCRAHNSHDLASLLTSEDHVTARRIIRAAETEQVWTGLRFLGDQWMWVGGGKAQYSDMDMCPGVNRCGALDQNSSLPFRTRECGETKSFLCDKKPPTS